MGGGSLTEGSDTKAVQEGWAYETPLLEAGCVLLGGTEQDFGFGLRQQYFRRADTSLMNRGDAAAATLIGYGDESRRRRGCDVDSPWDRVAAAATWIVRGGEPRPRPG